MIVDDFNEDLLSFFCPLFKRFQTFLNLNSLVYPREDFEPLTHSHTLSMDIFLCYKARIVLILQF